MHESNSSLGSLEPVVSFYHEFKPSIQSRLDLLDDMPLPNLQQENDIPMSLFYDFAPQISTLMDVTEDVLVSTAHPPLLITLVSLRRVKI